MSASTLLSRADLQHPNGGFEWTGYDLSDAIAIAKTDQEFASRMAYMDPSKPSTPQSRFHFGAAEDYIKLLVKEELGVLAQIKSVSTSRHGQVYWIMQGVCPFHRRVHSQQNWIISEGRKGAPGFARCMKPLKRFTATVHHPTKILGDLSLPSPMEKHEDRIY